MSYKEGGWKDKYIIYKRASRVRRWGMFKGTEYFVKVKVSPEAKYFVLRYDEDPHARKAMLVYAESVKKDNPKFAADILAKLNGVAGPAKQ